MYRLCGVLLVLHTRCVFRFFLFVSAVRRTVTCTCVSLFLLCVRVCVYVYVYVSVGFYPAVTSPLCIVRVE